MMLNKQGPRRRWPCQSPSDVTGFTSRHRLEERTVGGGYREMKGRTWRMLLWR